MYTNVTPPTTGQKITIGQNGILNVPDNPIIPCIEGDGTGPDIWRAAQRVLDAAVKKAYGGKKKIAWFEVFAGQTAYDKFQTWLPDDTVEAFREYLVGIKDANDSDRRRNTLAERRVAAVTGFVRMLAPRAIF